MSKKLRILAVDKDQDLACRLGAMFPGSQAEVCREVNLERIPDRFESGCFDILVVASNACRRAKTDGIEVLELIANNSPTTQILFLAEPEDIKAAMSALAAGTYQYAKLPMGDEELRLLIETALEKRPVYGTNLLLKTGKQEVKFEKLVGSSGPMQEIYRQIRQAAATNIPVLILGETGTGKDLAAQAIHQQSDRREGPYLPVNLGALPSELVGSELFGHEKGAFTGALGRREGKFEEARDGTVFLDEIATIDQRMQISLLRLIEQKTFTRLGGKQTISTNARLIAASNQNLSDVVDQGTFRKDLYFRLDVFRITLPPLRERRGDIVLLVDAFLRRYNEAFEKNILGVAPACISLLETYHWPGNVRELKNVIQRAALVCEGQVLLPEHLPPRFRSDEACPVKVSFEVGTSLAEVERQMIIRTLSVTQNNRKRAAELLGISRRALYGKLHKYHIE
ncbi:MAG: sigma-54-dependent Fis family transcriptional regulator [Sedimentisphaerales bacterium]|nr:sigma-54-dependent Fis family transcriptional regulator [Sedimentisphaerales bacterium]